MHTGIVAGCTFATSLIRVFAMEAFDSIPRGPDFDVYVDDLSLSATGTARSVVTTLVQGAKALDVAISATLRCELAMDKIGMVSSCRAVSAQLSNFLGPLVGDISRDRVTNLGVDYTAGRAVRAPGKGRSAKLKERAAAALRKTRRLARLGSMVGRKCVKVFAAGPLAGAVYGSDIFGVSDRELLDLRRMAMAGVKPSAQGRSLSVLSLLEGDPPWRACCAPIIRWAKEVWILQTRAFDWALGWGELRAGWDSVFSRDDHSWTKVSGPISALRMSLFRLGWTMPGFTTIVDDFGREISLTLSSPKLIKVLCREAVFRSLERDSGDKLKAGGRLCWDVPKTLLASRKISGKKKGMIRALSTNACWTAGDAADLGYPVSSLCALGCGCKDTLFHRIWVCPCVQEVRDEHIPSWIQKAALEVSEDDPERAALWLHGSFLHPGDYAPKPLSSDGVNLEWHVEALPDPARPGLPPSIVPNNGFWGHIFMDGSCYKHAVRELSRAGFAVVMVSDDGKLLGVLKGPVWAPWPQTPQASEFVALMWSALYTEAPADCYSDCSNVVLLQSLGVAEALGAKRQYAGCVLQARHHFGRFCKAFHKVAAHLNSDEEGISAGERFRRVGNGYADVFAKEGARRHPSLNPTELDEIDRKLDIARATLLGGAELVPLWPKVEFRGLERVQPPRAPKDDQLYVECDWARMGSSWRCRVCLRGSRATSKPIGGPECSGRSRLDQGVLDALGHSVIAFPCSDNSFLFLRMSCKFYSSGGMVLGLGRKCATKPTECGRKDMRKLRKGQHPDKKGVFVELDEFIPLL